jgi:hypothetical protein
MKVYRNVKLTGQNIPCVSRTILPHKIFIYSKSNRLLSASARAHTHTHTHTNSGSRLSVALVAMNLLGLQTPTGRRAFLRQPVISSYSQVGTIRPYGLSRYSNIRVQISAGRPAILTEFFVGFLSPSR